MFNFFKKKNLKKDFENTKTEKENIIIDDNTIKKDLENLEIQLNQGNLDDEDLSKIYQEKAFLLKKINKIDDSIENLEKSLNYHKNLGKGYKTLLNLYNMKRAEAAKNGNDEMLQHWLKKIDEMMQLSKDITRGKY